MGGPSVLMKHSTPCLKVREAKVASVISGYSSKILKKGDGTRTKFTPEISLLVDENCVTTPEWASCLRPRSIAIQNACRKSNPKIGLATCAIRNTKE